eukprot:scaffold10344_cov128-Cylindrotheca_fusiformis.AAC.2
MKRAGIEMIVGSSLPFNAAIPPVFLLGYKKQMNLFCPNGRCGVRIQQCNPARLFVQWRVS